MTITSTIATVADSISKLTISGVTIKDIDQIPDSARMLTPLVIPKLPRFITDISVSFDTFGSNGSPKISTNYTLNYMFIYCESGSGLGSFSVFGGLIAKLSEILDVINSNDAVAGAVDIKLSGLGDIGTITDPAGNDFWGLEFSLRVLEYTQ
jgi:hypothetical protein